MTDVISASRGTQAPRKKKMTAQTFIFKVLLYAFLTMAATVVLIPIISLVTVSLQPSDSSTTNLSWPTNPDWDNYLIAWT